MLAQGQAAVEEDLVMAQLPAPPWSPAVAAEAARIKAIYRLKAGRPALTFTETRPG